MLPVAVATAVRVPTARVSRHAIAVVGPRNAGIGVQSMRWLFGRYTAACLFVYRLQRMRPTQSMQALVKQGDKIRRRYYDVGWIPIISSTGSKE
jgi:hypothetical protein